MRCWTFVFILLLGCPDPVFCQVMLPMATDPSSQGMGGLLSPLTRHYQPAGNPAILAAIPTRGLGAYTLQPFGLTELSTSYLHGWMPQGQGGWGAGVSYSGFAGLRHVALYTSFGHRLWNRLDAGIQMEWQQVRLSDFGQRQHLSLTAGLRGHLRDDLAIGVVMRYPPVFRKSGRIHLPSSLSGTLAYRVSDQVEVAAEWYQEERLKPDFRFGFSYRPIPQLPLRFGYQAFNGAFTAGAGYGWRNQWSLEFAAGYHPYLGFSPSAGLIWALPAHS